MPPWGCLSHFGAICERFNGQSRTETGAHLGGMNIVEPTNRKSEAEPVPGGTTHCHRAGRRKS